MSYGTQRMTLSVDQLLLLTVLSIQRVLSDAVTEYPVSLRTGKLNQFVGFATPRPPPPTGGPFVYGSIWASWSAWSFCVNNVRVRVRACNTVRGFSCLGTNQEFMECELNHLQHAVHESEYEAVDPWEEDRREAMRQLYSREYPSNVQKTRSSSKTETDLGQSFQRQRQQTPALSGPFLPTTSAFQRGLPGDVQTGQQQSSNAVFGTRQHHLSPGQQPLLLPNDPEVQKQIEEIDKALRAFPPLPADVENPGESIPVSQSQLPPTGTTFKPVLFGSSQQPGFQDIQTLPLSNLVPGLPLVQSSLPSPQIPVQLAPGQLQLLQVSQMRHLPQTSKLPAQDHQAEAQAQVILTQNQTQSEKQETLVQLLPEPVQQFPVNLTQTEVPPAELLHVHPPINVVVQMPSDTVQVSQQTGHANNNTLFTTKSATLSPPVGRPRHPVIAMVNSAAPEFIAEGPSLPSLSLSQTSWPPSFSVVSSSLPQVASPSTSQTTGRPSLPPLSSSHTTWPSSLSLVSSSLVSLPQITSLLSTEPLLPTTTATAAPEATQALPVQQLPVPTARALNPEDIAGIVDWNFSKKTERHRPPSNVKDEELQNGDTRENHAEAVTEKRGNGISRKKPTELLGEVQGAPSETFPVQITEHLSKNKNIVKSDSEQNVKLAKQPFPLLYASRTNKSSRARTTLHSGEVDFSEQQSKKYDGETTKSTGTKVFAQKNAAIDDKLDAQSLINFRRTTKRPLPVIELESLSPAEQRHDSTEVDKIKKEIEKLKETMKAMKNIIGDSGKENAYEKAINLNLVPKGPPTPHPATTPVVVDQSRLILLSINERTPAEWTEWSEWQRCFCGKRIRTRTCQYEEPYLTKGCVGKSYESRPCDELDNCPTTTAPLLFTTTPPVTSTESRNGKPFKPLSVAIRKPDNVEVTVTAASDNDDHDISYEDNELLQQRS